MDIVSPYILAVIASWVAAQGGKYVFAIMQHRTFSRVRQLYLSGGMPSAHTASVIALLTVIGCRDGIGSGLFGLAALFAGIVMYDAVMVRRSSGEQGVAIQQLIMETSSRAIIPRAAKGHTPAEVVAGSVLGLGIGMVVFLATQ